MNTSAFVTEDSVVFQTDLMPFWNHDNRNGCRFFTFWSWLCLQCVKM